MKALSGMRAALIVALVAAGTASAAADDTATQPPSSTKDRGVVSISLDPALSQGRVVMKVVAFNRTREPAAFSDADVKIFTAAGKPMALVPLERLIEEVSGSSSPRRPVSADHSPTDYAHRPIPTTGGAGEPDLSGYTGAGNPTSGVVSTHTQVDTRPAGKTSVPDAATQQQIASLKAGILQSLIIPSAQAAGGQVVSEPLKLARKESRELRVTVDFNGEQHEFHVLAPRE